MLGNVVLEIPEPGHTTRDFMARKINVERRAREHRDVFYVESYQWRTHHGFAPRTILDSEPGF